MNQRMYILDSPLTHWNKYGVFIGYAYQLQAMCSLLMRTSPNQYVSKDRQHTCTHTLKLKTQLRSMHEMQHVRGVCALESSSLLLLLLFPVH